MTMALDDRRAFASRQAGELADWRRNWLRARGWNRGTYGAGLMRAAAGVIRYEKYAPDGAGQAARNAIVDLQVEHHRHLMNDHAAALRAAGATITSAQCAEAARSLGEQSAAGIIDQLASMSSDR